RPRRESVRWCLRTSCRVTTLGVITACDRQQAPPQPMTYTNPDSYRTAAEMRSRGIVTAGATECQPPSVREPAAATATLEEPKGSPSRPNQRAGGPEP